MPCGSVSMAHLGVLTSHNHCPGTGTVVNYNCAFTSMTSQNVCCKNTHSSPLLPSHLGGYRFALLWRSFQLFSNLSHRLPCSKAFIADLNPPVTPTHHFLVACAMYWNLSQSGLSLNWPLTPQSCYWEAGLTTLTPRNKRVQVQQTDELF